MINLGNAKLLSILLPAIILSVAAFAAAWHGSWGFENPVYTRAAFTKADAARYLSYFGETKEHNIPDSLEACAADDADSIARGEHPAALYNALPSADAIPLEKAVCIAYAYVEQTYQIPETTLLLMRPALRFLGNRNDPEHTLWEIYFHLPAESRADPDPAPFDHFLLSIDAETGMVVNCVNTSMPAAG